VSAREAGTNAERAFAEWVHELIDDIDYLDLIARAEHAGVSVDDLDVAYMEADVSVMWLTPVKKEQSE